MMANAFQCQTRLLGNNIKSYRETQFKPEKFQTMNNKHYQTKLPEKKVIFCWFVSFSVFAGAVRSLEEEKNI